MEQQFDFVIIWKKSHNDFIVHLADFYAPKADQHFYYL